MPKRNSKKFETKIVDDFKSNISATELMKKYDLSRGSVYHILGKYDIPKKKNYVTSLEKLTSTLKSMGFILLDCKKFGLNEDIVIRCSNNHIVKTTWNNVKFLKECKKCKKQARISKFIETVKTKINRKTPNYKIIDVNYATSTNVKITLKCDIGHIYDTNWHTYSLGRRCPVCSGRRKLTTEVVKNYIKEQGDTLIDSDYVNSSSKLKIKCVNNHIFNMTFNHYQQGHRCPKCHYKSCKLSIEQIKNELKKENYELSSNSYNGNKTHITVKCPNNHIYNVRWRNFKAGARCLTCYIESTLLTSEYMKTKIESAGYTLLTGNYVGSMDMLDIMCDKGHNYKTTWHTFQQGHRCPMCMNGNSNAEKNLLEKIKAMINNEHKIIENDRELIKPKELDIYIPVKNLAIEYCGLYWHSSNFVETNYHRKKLDACLKNNTRLITIFEDEWLNKEDVCLSRIRQALHIQTKRIYARKCDVKIISNKIANLFFEKYHLQGKTRQKIAFGLYYKSELIQVASIGSLSRRHVSKNTLELKRLCNKADYSVVGGASKLFKKCINYGLENNYDIIRSYNDLRWGQYYENIYKKLGFIKTHETKYTPHYVLKSIRIRNQSLRKTREEKKSSKTEWELRKKQGYLRIFDCGHQTWDFKLIIPKK